MKKINHKAFRTSPLGGYAGVSPYERRKSGGLARFGKDAVAVDFERMQQRIQNNDAVRGSALVLRCKRFKLFLKCLEILGIDQRIPNEDRENARHDGASETERCLRAAENIVHRRGRVSRLLLCHVNPVESGDGDGDSSADDAASIDGIKGEPFWPNHRNAEFRDPAAFKLAFRKAVTTAGVDRIKLFVDPSRGDDVQSYVVLKICPDGVARVMPDSQASRPAAKVAR